MNKRFIKFGRVDVSVDGDMLKVGDKAPDFKVTDNNLSIYKLSDDKNKIRLISVIPSVDTSICELQTLMFENASKNFSDEVSIITISNDLPFAQIRFREDKSLKRNKLYSDYIFHEFSEKYSTLINEWQILNRAVFVIDKDNTIVHIEYMDQNAALPDYDKAIEVVKDLDKKEA